MNSLRTVGEYRKKIFTFKQVKNVGKFSEIKIILLLTRGTDPGGSRIRRPGLQIKRLVREKRHLILV